MLKLTDLTVSKELNRKEMTSVTGGWNPVSHLFDGSTTLKNKVADVQQAFMLELNQGNAGEVTNNQAIQGGNGIIYAPVKQSLTQDNYLDVFGLGNTSVS